MNPGSSKNIPWTVLILIFILLVVLSFFSEGFYGGADNLTHYFISRYSFRYPHLFLDTWGKPVFTIMSSPFSQFGFMGLKLFNIVLGCISAYLAFLTAKKLGIKTAWIGILFVVFAPIYFLMMLTGLTEIQFGFILILSIYLFFKNKYIAAAIIISFLPLSRSEGFVLLPVFLIAFLMRRKFIAIPFLVTGLLFFSVLGYLFVWKDFFWIFTHSPYPLHHPLYKEKGDLLYFVISSPQIFGIPLLILFLGGTGLYGYLFFSVPKEQRLQIFLEIWMLVIPVWLMFTVNSILYWKALFGSMGLVRVVTGVLPLAAVVSLKAYEHFEKTFLRKETYRKVCLAVLIILLLIANFPFGRYPVDLLPYEQAVKNTTDWIKQQSLVKRKIFYTNNYIPYFLGLDPYNKEECDHLYGPEWLPYQPENSVVIWDSYFGANESKIPLDLLEKTYGYRLLNVFREKQYSNEVSQESWEICVFVKSPDGIHVNNQIIRDSILSKTVK
jgi:ABC-type cobalt transport system substrate-binding protein